MSLENQTSFHEIAIKAEQEFAKLNDGKLATQLLAIMAFEHHTAEQVAQIFKISVRTLFRWINKFAADGIDGLQDQPKGHYPAKLTETQKHQLKQWVTTATNCHGESVHWTLEKLVNQVASVFEVAMTPTALWQNLKKLNLTIKKPRPVHHRADQAAQQAFKKNSS